MKKLTILDLFSGLGGFSLGLERTGHFETVAFCENDQDCQKVLNKHYPDIPTFYNIQDLNPKTLSKGLEIHNRVHKTNIESNIDVVTASWPCQGHSVAGKKRGLKDERSGLWKEVKRLLQESKPGWFIGENSANLRTNGLTEVLQDLWEVGYRDIRWDILPAEAFGALHKRERIYIIANSHGIRLSEPPFTSSEREQERRSEAWTTFCSGKCPEPSFCRVVNEVPSELERNRKRQVKQYGNSLIPDIPEAIGNYIKGLV